MADRKNTVPPHEALAALNSHLGRFLGHADELLQECRTFAETTRTSLDTELDNLQESVAQSVAAASERALAQVTDHMGATLDKQIEHALGERLQILKRDVDQLVQITAQARKQVSQPPPRQPEPSRLPPAAFGQTPPVSPPPLASAPSPPRAAAIPPPKPPIKPSRWPIVLAAALGMANLALVAALLFVLVIGSSAPRGMPSASADPSAQTRTMGSTGHLGASPQSDPSASGAAQGPSACQTLRSGFDAAAAQVLMAAAAATCGPDSASQVAQTLLGAMARIGDAGKQPMAPANGPTGQAGQTVQGSEATTPQSTDDGQGGGPNTNDNTGDNTGNNKGGKRDASSQRSTSDAPSATSSAKRSQGKRSQRRPASAKSDGKRNSKRDEQKSRARARSKD